MNRFRTMKKTAVFMVVAVVCFQEMPSVQGNVQRKNLFFVAQPTSEPTVETPLPTQYPTHFPTPNPTKRPSKMPSNHPTMRPSSNPTESPTKLPSSAPTATSSETPSTIPSRKPSYAPSLAPSVKPTVSATPSASPSSVPSRMPSDSPTSVPSASPTLTCHDKAEYRSPINGLKCSDHSGTDCYQWRNIGLNTTELGRLINNCPETCNIPCGAFVHFQVPVSYQLSGIPGLLDDSAKNSLEQASFAYITKYIKAEVPNYIFEIDTVELSSQSTVSQRRRLRSEVVIAEEEEDVLVTVVFDGFSIGLQYDEISFLLVSGMNSTGFTSTLQDTDSFFENAGISSAESKDDTVHEPDDDKRGGLSTASLLLTIVVIAGVCVGFVYALLKRGKTNEWFPFRWFLSKRFIEVQESQEESLPESSQQGRPRFLSLDFSASVQSTETNRFTKVISMMKSLFVPVLPNVGKWRSAEYHASPSEKASLQSSRLSGQGSPLNLLSFDTASHPTNGLLRLIPNSSKSSTEPDDSKSGSNQIETDVQAANGLISPMSEGTEDSLQKEHPLSNIIPPMIVIDNIDENPSSQKKHVRSRSLVPGKHVEASPAFLSVLTGPSATPNMVFQCSELNAWKKKEDNDETKRVLSPLGIIVDSDSEDDSASYASTPIHSTTSKSELGLQRSWSANALDVLDSKKSPLHMLTVQTPSFPDPKIDELKSPLHWLTVQEPVFPLKDVYNFVNNENDEVSVEFIVDRQSSGSDIASRKAGHERKNSIRSRSPKLSTPKSTRRIPIPNLRRSSVKRKEINSQLGKSKHDQNDEVARRLAVIDPSSVLYKPEQLYFEAPRTGQLGLVIEARSSTGPRVHSVKDYSPLFGKIKAGDKILEIDGKNQSGSSLSDVMHLLASKSARKSNNSSLKIVVERTRADEGYSKSDSRHTRDSSCSSRVIEDSDTFIPFYSE